VLAIKQATGMFHHTSHLLAYIQQIIHSYWAPT